ncbi:MAG: hypothetical protein ACK41C_17940 [Phenylobacterium sp.]|jgi:hypothetical protein|uniref:hypothetical protein n=1 Tax=Phenylobacterium sp. TaxID=1871053 RepID=UPI00391D65B3
MKSRWGAAAVAGILAVASISAVAVGRSVEDEESGAPLTAMLRDPLALLAMRSPGERGPGALLNSKPPRAKAEPAPVERVLSTVRERPAAIEPLEAAAPVIEPLPAVFDILPPGAEFVPVDALNDEGSPGWRSPWWSPGPSGGGGGVLTPSPPSPVPEPDVWLMMILGVFGVGALLRRANARRARSQA